MPSDIFGESDKIHRGRDINDWYSADDIYMHFIKWRCIYLDCNWTGISPQWFHQP